ncbi:hypothetical protein LshimejAT787_1201900 [Lyophyllum shimeji]|uniref:Protein CPL1-like domain-containing protein n=1 Tax=Lyophyllum shimeji TaxID=47721 RepID=A0A9P3PW50_LYOSH|nr:hypothetical protein LshimejAT787_1201900 [Lyophyllum shimeji]
MRYFAASAFFLASLLSSAVAFNHLIERADATADVCGEVDDLLKVPNVFLPGKSITIGKITACLCISTLPHFMSTNALAISASALVGKPKTNAALTELIRGCPWQSCRYPPHSVPECQHGNPCGFTCKDGYTPYPSYRPTMCVCNKPFTECNGKCGMFHGCPSGYVKRDLHYGTDKQCPRGLSACGVLGRGARSWECINTQTELESCGGCTIPLYNGQVGPEGRDCTVIEGVSDVSCVKGRCLVHRCMPGYEVNTDGDSCVYVEDKDPVLLAAQYGLEHVPL